MGGVLGYGQYEMDIRTGTIINWKQLHVIADNQVNLYVTMAYRDYDDRVYGYGFTPDGRAYGFSSAPADDIDASAMIKEVPFEEVCTALCYNVQDDLFYGVTTQGVFVSIDKDGNQTSIFGLGIPNLSSTVSGLVYSPIDGKYIYNAYLKDQNSAMYAIDWANEECLPLYNCLSGEEYMFMVTTDENAAPSAPQKPNVISYSFNGASYNGTAKIQMPSFALDGTTLSGSLPWRLYIDGMMALDGTAQAGAKTDINLNVATTECLHSFAISVGKDDNWSVPAIFSCWVGNDVPKAPENVVLQQDGTVTWNAVTEGVHGGYVDFSNIEYTIYLNGKRMDATMDNSVKLELPSGLPFNSYTATVEASVNDQTSECGASNYITFGEPLAIDPSIHYHPEEYEFELFKAIDIDGVPDSEGNPRNWHFSTTMGFPSFASGAAGDDLLIFPPMNFDDTSKAYKFMMEAGLIHDMDNTGTLEVWIGKEPTLEGMTQCIIPARRFYYMRGDIVEEYFAVKEAGTYYIGIRTKTGKVGFHISDMDIARTERDADVPVAVNDLKAVAGANGALNATVTFTMPTKTANGTDIPATTDLAATIVSRTFVLDQPHSGEVKETKTVTGKPGSQQTVGIATHQNDNTIGVSVAMDGRSGSEAVTKVYTGLVKPYIVNNLKGEISEDNMSVKLTWDPPTEAQSDDGLIGDTFYYSLWYYGNGWELLDELGWDVLEAEVTLEPGAGLQAQSIGVLASNAAGNSDYVESVSAIIGTPYELPMEENMDGGYETYSPIMIQRPSPEYENTFWEVNDPAAVAALFANKSGIAYIGYIGTEGVQSAKARLSLPKFSTERVSNIQFTLTYWGGPFAADMSLLGGYHGLETPATIGSFPAGSGWMTNSIDVPETYYGRKWVELFLDSDFKSADSFALFSGYAINGVTGIEGVENMDGTHGRIYASQGMVHALGFAGQRLQISDISGNILVDVAELQDMQGFAMRPGIYIVKAGTTTSKLIVK